jgi:hypothetical protein
VEANAAAVWQRAAKHLAVTGAALNLREMQNLKEVQSLKEVQNLKEMQNLWE